MIRNQRSKSFMLSALCVCSIFYYFVVYNGLYRDWRRHVVIKLKHLQGHGLELRKGFIVSPYGTPEKQRAWEEFRNSEYNSSFAGGLIESSVAGYLINTPACTLPVVSLWPKYYREDWEWLNDPSPDCRGKLLMVTLSEDESTLDVNESAFERNCTLYEILSDPESDNDFILEYQYRLNESTVDVSNMEMMMIECDNGTRNFEATIAVKEVADEKIHYWSDKPDRPPSVLLIGFDSTARMHALRGLKRSVEIMEELEFLDFKGFHSVEGVTLTNFMALLMGITRDQATNGCAPKWSSPYDNCPLIWKNFSDRNYLTAYIEDGGGGMNWGGQSGFKEHPPTDYYLRPLLRAVDYEDEECVSTESVSAFQLRYLRRWLQSFSGKAPFFFFNYMCYPYHDSNWGIPTVDEHLASFLASLKTLPDIMSNTLVIILGDHGNRYGFHSTDRQESYFEQALPPLFIRIPDKLKEKYPEFEEIALENTGRLTSAFDVHHTLLHILSLINPEDDPRSRDTAPEFIPTLGDRSSVFFPIPTDRTCDTINVFPGFCVCNGSAVPRSLEDPVYLARLVDYAVDELNEVLDDSKYEPLCESWDKSLDYSLYSALVLEERNDSSQILEVQFPVYPGDNIFSVKIRVDNESALWKEGSISRLTPTRNETWCVPSETDEDKLFKNYCYCIPEDE